MARKVKKFAAKRAKATKRAGAARFREKAKTARGTTARAVSQAGALRVRETAAQRQARAARILAALRKAYPDAQCALHHRDALELLVATILSAQCTDQRVNQVTPGLFQHYPTAAAYAAADPAALETEIRSTGFFRNKTKSLIGVGRTLRDEYAGRVPDDMDRLLQLPGVARKTANCVLGTWYGKNEGVVVDTHVGRVTMRLALVPEAKNDKDATKIERDLMQLFPRDTWTWLAHALIEHGRKICVARKPKCDECPLAPDCPSAFTFD